jgi:hypothetical protein
MTDNSTLTARLDERLDYLAKLSDGWYNGTGTAVATPVLDAARTFARTLVELGAAGAVGNSVLIGPGLGDETDIEFESPVSAQREFDATIARTNGTISITVTQWLDDGYEDAHEELFTDPVAAATAIASHVNGEPGS